MYPFQSRERMSAGEFCNKFMFRFFFSLIGDTHLFVDVFFFFSFFQLISIKCLGICRHRNFSNQIVHLVW